MSGMFPKVSLCVSLFDTFTCYYLSSIFLKAAHFPFMVYFNLFLNAVFNSEIFKHTQMSLIAERII